MGSVGSNKGAGGKGSIQGRERERETKPDVKEQLANQLDAITKATKDKSVSKEQITEMVNDFKKILNDNIQVSESGISNTDMDIKHLFNVTADRVWYTNKANTVFILAPNQTWHKLNKNGVMTYEGKLSLKDNKRVIALANKLMGIG